MPFHVAHSLIGVSIGAALDRRVAERWQLLCLCGLLGVCPDFDYGLNWLTSDAEDGTTGLHIP